MKELKRIVASAATSACCMCLRGMLGHLGTSHHIWRRKVQLYIAVRWFTARARLGACCSEVEVLAITGTMTEERLDEEFSKEAACATHHRHTPLPGITRMLHVRAVVFRDAYFPTENPNYPENSLFPRFSTQNPQRVPSHCRKKHVFLGRELKSTPPLAPCAHKPTRFVLAFRQSFSANFTVHNSSSNSRGADGEYLSNTHRFQLIVLLFVPSSVSSCSRPSIIIIKH